MKQRDLVETDPRSSNQVCDPASSIVNENSSRPFDRIRSANAKRRLIRAIRPDVLQNDDNAARARTADPVRNPETMRRLTSSSNIGSAATIGACSCLIRKMARCYRNAGSCPPNSNPSSPAIDDFFGIRTGSLLLRRPLPCGSYTS